MLKFLQRIHSIIIHLFQQDVFSTFFQFFKVSSYFFYNNILGNTNEFKCLPLERGGDVE